MASGDQRITMEYPVDVTKQPTTHDIVEGTPGKIDQAEVREMRALVHAHDGATE